MLFNETRHYKIQTFYKTISLKYILLCYVCPKLEKNSFIENLYIFYCLVSLIGILFNLVCFYLL